VPTRVFRWASALNRRSGPRPGAERRRASGSHAGDGIAGLRVTSLFGLERGLVVRLVQVAIGVREALLGCIP
jgi:hypothetical protein